MLMLPELKTMLLSTVAIVRKIWPRPSVQIPANEVSDYVAYQEKPAGEVSEESNEEADLKVSGIDDNRSVNDGHCQVNPAKDIQSSVPVD